MITALGMAGLAVGAGLVGIVGEGTGRAVGVAGTIAAPLGVAIGATVGSEPIGDDGESTKLPAGVIAMHPAASSATPRSRALGKRMAPVFSPG
jgi:hypothetical protein